MARYKSAFGPKGLHHKGIHASYRDGKTGGKSKSGLTGFLKEGSARMKRGRKTSRSMRRGRR